MTARDVVTSRIAEQARRFPDVLLSAMDISDLDARDAALAQAIEHAVMRRWLTLVTIIESRLSRPWGELEAKLQAVLLVGAAQLLLLERVPDHAVLNVSVTWAKRHVRPKAGGLVNAVLRKVAALRGEIVQNHRQRGSGPQQVIAAPNQLPLHDGRIRELTEAVFDQRPVQRLAQQTSHAQALISQWMNLFGQERMIELALHSLVHAPIIVHGFEQVPATAELTPHDEPGFYVFTGENTSLRALLQAHPTVIVQDSTSAAPVSATDPLQPAPSLIVDACAGRGTKTRQLASVHPQARIVASDIDQARFDTLRRQFADHDRVHVVAYRDLLAFNGQADLLVLDVPCSNSGVLARRVEARYRFTPAAQQKIVDLQRQVVADNLALLRPTGRLLYSTCSIEATENSQQAHWICKWHPFRIASERTQLPEGLPGDAPSSYRDGGYYAILERTAKR